jgi:hypothetical protein
VQSALWVICFFTDQNIGAQHFRALDFDVK